MIPPLQMLSVSSYGSIDDDTHDPNGPPPTSPGPTSTTTNEVSRIKESIVKLIQDSHYEAIHDYHCIEVDNNGHVSAFTTSTPNSNDTASDESINTIDAYIEISNNTADTVETHKTVTAASWFKINMNIKRNIKRKINHVVKSLMCIDQDNCCGSFDSCQSSTTINTKPTHAHIASSILPSSLSSKNVTITDKLSDAYENGINSFWPQDKSTGTHVDADADATSTNPHPIHTMSKEEQFYTKRWNGYLPLAAMDAANIAIQRNTFKQHRIMRARGMKVTHTRPRTRIRRMHTIGMHASVTE